MFLLWFIWAVVRAVSVKRADLVAENLALRQQLIILQVRPEHLFPLWSCVDTMEQLGEMPPGDTLRWKHGIFGLMDLWGLEPDDPLTPTTR